MKNVLLAAVIAAGATAVASADVKLDFGSGTYVGGQSSLITLSDLQGSLTGFSVSFDYVTNTTGSWASDAALVLNGAQWGGYDIFLSSGFAFNGVWGFDGPGSAGSGHYSDVKSASDSYVFGNSYTFEWGNGYSFSDPVDYNNVTVTLFGVSQVPAPGAAALLGLAGLVGRRRRA